MQRYRLTKINKVEQPLTETASTVEEYRDSHSYWWVDGRSPSIDYYVEGTLLSEPITGTPLIIHRDNRNGVEVDGIMMTTNIQGFEKKDGYIELTTQNSVYILEEIESITRPTNRITKPL
jgi:hypothetical protein